MDEQAQANNILGEAPDLEAEIQAYEERHPGAIEELPEEAVEAAEEAVDEEVEDEPKDVVRMPEKEEQKGSDTVPLAVFLDVKNELKELKKSIAEAQKPREEPKAPEGPPQFAPSVRYEDDPAEYLRQENSHLRDLFQWQQGQIESTSKLTAEQRQAQQAEAGYRQFANTVTVAEEQFRSQAPDYDEAVDFVRQSRYAEARAVYEANGIELSPEHDRGIRQAITQEFAALAANALQNNRNPASVLYTLAKARGFSGSPGAQPAETADKISRLERGVERAKSTQGVPGTRPTAEPVEQDYFKQLQREAGYRK